MTIHIPLLSALAEMEGFCDLLPLLPENVMNQDQILHHGHCRIDECGPLSCPALNGSLVPIVVFMIVGSTAYTLRDSSKEANALRDMLYEMPSKKAKRSLKKRILVSKLENL